MKGPKRLICLGSKSRRKRKIVIPKEAREIFEIEPGDTLLLLGDEEQGIAIVNGGKFTELANKIFGAQRKGEGE